jgi:extracellular matrix protein 14
MDTMIDQFPEALRKISIGKTYEGREIPAYMLALYQRSDNWETIAKNRPAILIDGLHHAREMSSMSQCVYSTMSFLFNYSQRDPSTLHLLKNIAVFIVPAVNYDGYVAIAENYQ